MLITETDLSKAFNKNDSTALKKVHHFLNENYYQIMYGNNEDYFTTNTILKFKRVEKIWTESQTNVCLAHYDCYQKINSATDIESALSYHPIYAHKLFDYLEHSAGLHDLKYFIQNDAVLNLEFFDYLVLAIVGTTAQAKAEIASNIWDEAGRGNANKFHTDLFKRLMEDLDISYNREKFIEDMSWEGLAGINLYSNCALYPYNKMKYFGLLAATELLDPPHYKKLNAGIVRMSPNSVNQSYYIEHESIDIEHAQGWIDRVILPEIKNHPEKLQDFWLGFYMRLDSTCAYYDNLLSLFHQQAAA